MATVASLIWVYCLVLLPFTAFLTLMTTFVVCNLVLNETRTDEKLHFIFDLKTDRGYPWFVTGFILIFLQFSLILIGRLQYLCQSQLILSRTVLLINHLIGLIGLILMLILGLLPVKGYQFLILLCTIGMFICLFVYCCFHTFVIIYLYRHRNDADQHSNLFFPVWFASCTLLILIIFPVWFFTVENIVGYIVFASPLLYFFAFVPQFWFRAKSRKRDSVIPPPIFFRNSSIA